MEKKIAVLSDAEGAPTTLTLAESIIVYARGKEQWQEISSFSCAPYSADTPRDLRILGQAAADALGDVRVILGSDISGASYFALNRAGFLMCVSQGVSDEFLDKLFEELDADVDVRKIENAESNSGIENAALQKTLITPRPCDLPGHYFINLLDAQQCNPMLSTKKILRPFLEETLFVELAVLCSHTPPWLQTDLPILGLAMTVKKTDTGSYMLTITHNMCEE